MGQLSRTNPVTSSLSMCTITTLNVHHHHSQCTPSSLSMCTIITLNVHHHHSQCPPSSHSMYTIITLNVHHHHSQCTHAQLNQTLCIHPLPQKALFTCMQIVSQLNQTLCTHTLYPRKALTVHDTGWHRGRLRWTAEGPAAADHEPGYPASLQHATACVCVCA